MTNNAPKGLPEETGNLQKIYHGDGWAPAGLILPTKEWFGWGGYPSKMYTQIAKTIRSASACVFQHRHFKEMIHIVSELALGIGAVRL